tara:strand:+ start:233 stop:358 length:126 start_codon:yes stop_codon:yes gene_type:complete
MVNRQKGKLKKLSPFLTSSASLSFEGIKVRGELKRGEVSLI